MRGIAAMRDAAIRKLKVGDLEELVELMSAHAAYERAPFVQSGKAERLAAALLGSEARASCWVADLSGGLIAYATFSPEFSTWDAAEYLHMDTLFVQSGFRGHGLGARLLTKAKDEAALLGLANLQWQTPENNRDAIRFYRRIGAQGRRKVRFTLSVSQE